MRYKSIVDFTLLTAASKTSLLYYDVYPCGSNDQQCENCGKYGWTHLLGIGKPEEMEGHLQNAAVSYILGPSCFKKIKSEVGGKWQKFPVEYYD